MLQYPNPQQDLQGKKEMVHNSTEVKYWKSLSHTSNQHFHHVNKKKKKEKKKELYLLT